jgi:RHS repeat-associated protein
MVFDQTGTLANVKRHDYLPFGEELFAGTGGRTVAQGYAADGVRQQFTAKERDSETGLDYFGARYFASTQGRFTSADPLLASARTGAPQSWNRYSYVLNNPLKLIDPTGLADDDPQKKKDEQPQGSSQAPPPAQQPQIPINVGEPPPPLVRTVTFVVPTPSEYVNLRSSDGTFFTGVASNLEITPRDAAGNAIPGILVSETVVNAAGTPVRQRQTPGEVRPDGSFPDLVGVGLESATPLSQDRAANVVTQVAQRRTNQVTIQTLRFFAPEGYSLGMAIVHREFTNLNVNNQVRPTTNRSGRPVDNYSITVRLVTTLPPEK